MTVAFVRYLTDEDGTSVTTPGADGVVTQEPTGAGTHPDGVVADRILPEDETQTGN